MITFTQGDWLRWTTPQHVKEGQVVVSSGPSLVVEWLGGERQVFPTYEGYVAPFASGEYRMEHIPRPPKASRIERDTKRGVMSIARAAATLGKTPKQIRAALRAGTLQGEQVDGRWVSVELD